MANDFIKMQPGRKFSPPKEEWFWKFWCWPILKSQPTVMFPSATLPAEWSLSPSQSQAPAPLSTSPRSKRSLSWVAKISQFWSSQFLRCSYHSCHDWSKFILEFSPFAFCCRFTLIIQRTFSKSSRGHKLFLAAKSPNDIYRLKYFDDVTVADFDFVWLLVMKEFLTEWLKMKIDDQNSY